MTLAGSKEKGHVLRRSPGARRNASAVIPPVVLTRPLLGRGSRIPCRIGVGDPVRSLSAHCSTMHPLPFRADHRCCGDRGHSRLAASRATLTTTHPTPGIWLDETRRTPERWLRGSHQHSRAHELPQQWQHRTSAPGPCRRLPPLRWQCLHVDARG